MRHLNRCACTGVCRNQHSRVSAASCEHWHTCRCFLAFECWSFLMLIQDKWWEPKSHISSALCWKNCGYKLHHSTTFSSLTDKPFQFWTRRANFSGILNSFGGGVQLSREGELHKLYTLGALAHFTGAIAKTRLHSSVNNNVWRDAARLLPKDPHGVCLLSTCLDFRWACRGLWRLSWKQANAATQTNKEKRGGGITPCVRSLGLNANPSMFVVLLQMLQIHTRALLPPTHPELF